MSSNFNDFLRTETGHLHQAGLFKSEFVQPAAQGAELLVDGRPLLNFASSDFLGLAQDETLRAAAHQAIDKHGLGLSADRLTASHTYHQQLETKLAKFLGHRQALVLPSHYHAALGLFEGLFSEGDALFCDELVHPSIADGLRLSRARLIAYAHQDLDDLEDRLRRSRSARFRAIISDSVFPLEGIGARLADIRTLAQRYDAIVIADDSLGLGIADVIDRGSFCGLGDRQPEIVVGTLGAALGSGGGFISGGGDIIAWLKQRCRPYLLCDGLDPAACNAALVALRLLEADDEPVTRMRHNTDFTRSALSDIGLRLIASDYACVVASVGSSVVAQRTADLLFRQGVYAVGFCHPVVPEGDARIRLHICAHHTESDLSTLISTFGAIAEQLKIV